MPNPSRTWTIAINQTFSTAVDQQVQFREACYALKVLMVAAGWTVTRSSDGTTAGAADYWTSAAALEINTSGSGAWVTLTSPVGWASATASIVLYINNASADTTPQTMAIRGTTGTYSGGSVSALPTASATETAVSATPNILGHATVVDARYSTWRSSRGDVMFAVKTAGVSGFTAFVCINSNAAGNGGGRGDNRWWITQITNSSDCLTRAVLISGSYTGSLASGGSAVGPVLMASGVAWSATGWTSGLDYSGETVMSIVEATTNETLTGRQLGQWIDTYAVPTSLAFGVLDDSETAQTQRRVCVGDIAIYAPTASLPFA
jgi:hypothetical protein